MALIGTTGYDLSKIARVHATAHQILGELHDLALDDSSRLRLEGLTVQTLIVLGSAVPPELLDELGRLMAPAKAGHASDAELRVVWAQILGWTGGIGWPPAQAYELPVTDATAPDVGHSQTAASPYL